MPTSRHHLDFNGQLHLARVDWMLVTVSGYDSCGNTLQIRSRHDDDNDNDRDISRTGEGRGGGYPGTEV